MKLQTTCAALALALAPACKQGTNEAGHAEHREATPASSSWPAPPANPVQAEMRLLTEMLGHTVRAIGVGDVRPIEHELHSLHAAKAATAAAVKGGAYKLPKNPDQVAAFEAMDNAFHEQLEGLSLADGMAGVRASDAVNQNIAKDRATSAAQNFQSTGMCSSVGCTNGRPARPDNRLPVTVAAHPSEPCCTSWLPVTRRRYSPSCATPTPRAAGCRATSNASSPRIYAAASSRTASHACAARRAVARSWWRSAASAAESARAARRAAWRTPRRIWWSAYCRAHPTGNGCSRYPSRCAWCSRAIRVGRAGSADWSFARSARGRGASRASAKSARR